MIRKILTMALVLLFTLSSMGLCEEYEYCPRIQSSPVFAAIDNTPEYRSREMDGDDSDFRLETLYPAGAFFYNWYDEPAPTDVPEGYTGFRIDENNSAYIPDDYVSLQVPAAKIPLFVGYCEDWVSLRKEPSASSSRIAKLEYGTRIDNWQIYNNNFIYAEVNGKSGYVSLDYIFIPNYWNGMRGTIKNCEEWVSLRAEPDSSSERLMKVPLGTNIEKMSFFCDDDYEEFMFCEINGVIGFIHTDYIG